MKDDRLFYSLRRKGQVFLCKVFGPTFATKIYFKNQLSYKPNFKNPKSFNEKIQWLKLYKWPNDDFVSACTDKIEVRKYVEEKGLKELLPNIYWIKDSEKDIDWSKLPGSFVIKCNHGCSYNLVCRDKNDFSIKYAIKKLKKWKKQKFGYFNAELHYNKISPKIYCEEFLGTDVVDFKFYFNNGKLLFFYIATGLQDDKDVKHYFFEPNCKPADFKIKGDPSNDFELPNNIEDLIEYSKLLAGEFLFVRVDLVMFDGKIYFSELTFSPFAGLMKFDTKEHDFEVGKRLLIGTSDE